LATPGSWLNTLACHKLSGRSKSRLYVGLLKTMIRGGKKFTHSGNETND
jgi:hypothetical protein